MRTLKLTGLMLLLTSLSGCGLGLCAESTDCVLDVPATALFLTLDVSYPDALHTRVAFTGGSGAITWSSSHAADATVRLFRHSSRTGGCSTKTFIDSVSEAAGGTGGTYNWDTTGMPLGTYYICVQLTDGVETVDAWADGAIQVNGSPTFAFVQPLGNDDYVKAGNTFNVSWTATDSDSDASIAIYLKTTNTGACNVGTQIAAGLNETSTTNWNFTATLSHDSNEYYLCAIINDGVNAPTETHSAMLTNYRDCLWTGGTTAFATAGNWTSCNSVAPTFVDRIEVPAAAPNQPILSASRSIGAFSEATGGGTLTINAGATLTLRYSPATIGSSITVQPSSAACTTCDLRGVGQLDTTIVNDAILTLQPGISFRIGELATSELRVGTSTSPGHLVVNGGGTPAQYPVIQNYAAVAWDRFGGIVVQGVDATHRSSLTVNGLTLTRFSGDYPVIGMSSYSQLNQLDNVRFSTSTSVDGSDLLRNGQLVRFWNCTGSTSVASFNGIEANVYNLLADAGSGYPDRGALIIADGTNCTAGNGFGITVNGTGSTWGTSYEIDPNNIINWTNGAAFTCTWTGAVNTAWNNAGNWSACANGRGGYPDGNDIVIIPSAPVNQPTVSGYQQAQSIGPGSGGTITVAAGAYLQLRRASTTFAGDIRLRGATANCTTCQVRTNTGSTIYNGATVTLLTGINWQSSYYGISATTLIGNGVTAGHLATLAADPSYLNWPRITAAGYGTSLYVRGTSGDPSTVNIDGLHMQTIATTVPAYAWRFGSYYDIDKFDNIIMDSDGTNSVQGKAIQIDSCATGTFIDTTWNEIDFYDAIFIPVPAATPPYATPPKTGRNVDIAADCTTIAPLHIYPRTSGSNLGHGAADATDPGGVITWH